MIGGHDDHRRLRVALRDDPGRQAHAGGGVARGGLGDHVFGGQVGELSSRRLGLVGPGDDQDPISGHQWLDPRHRLLEHRRLAGEAQQLLGPIAAALGPEPGPAAAGHDDCV